MCKYASGCWEGDKMFKVFNCKLNINQTVNSRMKNFYLLHSLKVRSHSNNKWKFKVWSGGRQSVKWTFADSLDYYFNPFVSEVMVQSKIKFKDTFPLYFTVKDHTSKKVVSKNGGEGGHKVTKKCDVFFECLLLHSHEVNSISSSHQLPISKCIVKYVRKGQFFSFQNIPFSWLFCRLAVKFIQMMQHCF